MGIRHTIIHQLLMCNEQLGGARSTKVKRGKQGQAFVEWYLEQCETKPRRLADIDPSVLSKYADHLNKTLMPGSVQTYLGYVRRLLRAGGVNLSGYESNREIGVPLRNRDGTKEPYPDEWFEDLLVRAHALDPGMFHVLRIERLLGVRGLEALMSPSSVNQWIEEIEYLGAVHITRGTKGGRERYTDVLKAHVAKTHQALVEGAEYLRKHTYFIKGKSKGLKSARQRYHALAKKLKMTGKYAPHSLRYAWACEKAVELSKAGLTRKEILSFLSRCLGHGDARRRWVQQVYIARVLDQLPPPTRKAHQLYEWAVRLRGLKVIGE